jgi:plasmid stabilization system protein ParE
MKVRWSNRAATEFATTVAYVAGEFGVGAAQKMRNGIDKAVESISQFPRIGVASFTDEESGVEFRELQCHLNSVVYAIYNNEIYIVSIWHNRQNRDNLYSVMREDAKSMLF